MWLCQPPTHQKDNSLPSMVVSRRTRDSGVHNTAVFEHLSPQKCLLRRAHTPMARWVDILGAGKFRRKDCKPQMILTGHHSWECHLFGGTLPLILCVSKGNQREKPKPCWGGSDSHDSKTLASAKRDDADSLAGPLSGPRANCSRAVRETFSHRLPSPSAHVKVRRSEGAAQLAARLFNASPLGISKMHPPTAVKPLLAQVECVDDPCRFSESLCIYGERYAMRLKLQRVSTRPSSQGEEKTMEEGTCQAFRDQTDAGLFLHGPLRLLPLQGKRGPANTPGPSIRHCWTRSETSPLTRATETERLQNPPRPSRFAARPCMSHRLIALGVLGPFWARPGWQQVQVQVPGWAKWRADGTMADISS